MWAASLRHFLQLRDEDPKFSYSSVVCGVSIAINYAAAQKVVFVSVGGICCKDSRVWRPRQIWSRDRDSACQQWHELVSESFRK